VGYPAVEEFGFRFLTLSTVALFHYTDNLAASEACDAWAGVKVPRKIYF
jgi:hypothetical protein